MIKVVSSSWCGQCHSLKAQLKQRKVGYTEIDADTDEGMEFCKANNVRSLPTTFLYNEKGELIKTVVGNKIQEIV